MSTDLAKLVANLEINAAKFTSGLNQGVAELTAFRNHTEEVVAGVKEAFSKIGEILIFGEIAKEIRALSDEGTRMTNQLRGITEGTEDLVATQKALYASADATRAPIVQLTENFNKLARSGSELGLSNQTFIDLNNEITESVKAEGGSMEQVTSVIDSFGRAMLTGAASTRDLRTWFLQAPGFAKSLAAGLDVTTQQLGAMAKAGQLTSRVLVSALQQQSGEIAAEFQKTNPLIEEGFTALKNAAIKFFQDLNAGGGLNAVASGIIALTRHFSELAITIGVTAGIAGALYAGSLIGRVTAWIQGTIASVDAAKRLAVANYELASARVAETTAAVRQAEADGDASLVQMASAALYQRQTEAILAQKLAAEAAAAPGAGVGLLEKAFSKVLAPARALFAALSNPVTATAAGIVGTAAAVVYLSDKIHVTADSTITLREVWQQAMSDMADAVQPVGTAIEIVVGGAWDVVKEKTKDFWEWQKNAGRDAGGETASLFGQAFTYTLDSVFGGSTVAAVQSGWDHLVAQINTRNISRAATDALADASKNWNDRHVEITPMVDPKAKEQIDQTVESMHKSAIAQREGALAALEYDMRNGKLGDTLQKLGLDADAARQALRGATTDQASAGIEKTIQQLTTQAATFDKGDVATLNYSIAQGELKTRLADTGDQADKYARQLRNATLGIELTKFETMAQDLEQQDALFQATDMAALEYKLTHGKLAAQLRETGKAGDEMRERMEKAQASLDTKKIAADIAQLQQQILQGQGATAQAAMLQFDAQNQALKKSLMEKGDVGGLQTLDTLRQQTEEQAKVNQLQDEAGRIQDRLAMSEQKVQLAMEQGTTSEYDGLTQISGLRAQSLTQLDDINTKMQAIAATSSDPTLIINVQKFGSQIGKLASQVDAFGNQVRDDLVGPFTTAFTDLITGAKSAGQTVVAMLQAIGQEMAKLVSQQVAAQAAGGIAKWLGLFLHAAAGAGSSSFSMDDSISTDSSAELIKGTSNAGSDFHFATGGQFTVGGAGGVDSSLVKFRATPGEMVNVSTPGQVNEMGNAKASPVISPTYNIDARGATVDLTRALPGILKDNNRKMFDELDRRYGFKF